MQARWRMVLALSIVPLLLAQGAVVALSHKAAERLVHPPRDPDPATPEAEGLDFESVTIASADSVDLAGWWIPAPRADAPVVVFLHGYGASKAQALAVAPFLHRAGYHVLAFDFRGHGASGGTYTTLGLDEADDVRAAVEHARSRDGATGVALLGWSMGAVAALRAAPGLEVDAVVVDSPFTSLSGVVSRAFTRSTGLPDFPFVRMGFAFAGWMTDRDVQSGESVTSARDVDLPILIIQGLRDSLVGPDAGEALHQAAPRSQLWLVPDADHVDAVHRDRAEYEARVVAFLTSSLT